MAAKTIVEIARSILREVSGDELESLTGDQEAGRSLLALANKVGDALGEYGDVRAGWPALRGTFNASVEPGDITGYTEIPVPDDFDRIASSPVYVGQYPATGPIDDDFEAAYLANPSYYHALSGYWRIGVGLTGLPRSGSCRG